MITLLIILTVAAVASWRRTSSLRCSMEKGRLVASIEGLRSDAPDGIGVSVLCRAESPERVERLLSSEYARYEVVATVDGDREAVLFSELAARYRMIEVEWSPTGEIPAAGVRRVLRSRRRCFRRLVVVDFRGTEDAAMDAAAEVASHDYLLPLPHGRQLLRGAVEQLVAEVASAPARAVKVVVCTARPRIRLVAREVVAAGGGFALRPWLGVPRTAWRRVATPLVVARPRSRIFIGLLCICALAAFLLSLAAAASARWLLSAILATTAVVALSAAYGAQLRRLAMLDTDTFDAVRRNKA